MSKGLENKKEDNEAQLPATGQLASLSKKTPLYQAKHSARYGRQELIKAIQQATGRKLICYMCGQDTSIDRDDIQGFVDLVHHIPVGTPIDLMIQTFGGNANALDFPP